jgi:hypothetical protein
MLAIGLMRRLFSGFIGPDQSTFIERRYASPEDRAQAERDLALGPVLPTCWHCQAVGKASTTKYVNVLRCDDCGGLFGAPKATD